MLKTWGAAVSAIALAVTPASSACWSIEETSAATIRDFQTMLMVSTLTCQVAKHDMTADYNEFLRANKAAVQRVNDRIKTHFIKANGPVMGMKSYDGFVTRLANAYGSRGSSAEICDNMAAVAREATLMGGNEDGLLLLAERQGIVTAVPEGACSGPRQSVALNGAPIATGRGSSSGDR